MGNGGTATKPKMGDEMGKLPDGLVDKTRMVEIPGQKPITVHKWSVMKLIAMNEMMAQAADGVTKADMAVMKSGDVGGIMGLAMRKLGPKLIEVVEMSVAQEDRGRIREMDTDDFLGVVEAVVEMNVTEKLLGKLRTLGAGLRVKWQASGTR